MISFMIQTIFFNSVSWAGLIMDANIFSKDFPTQKMVNMKMKIDSKGISMNQELTTDRSVHIIFVAATQSVLVLNDEEKSYSEIKSEDLSRVKSAVEKIKADFGVENGTAAVVANVWDEIQFSKSGKKEKIGKFDCTKFEGKKDNRKVADLWTTMNSQLKMNKAEKQTFNNFNKFFATLDPSIAQSTRYLQQSSDGGAPIKQQVYDVDGKVISSFEVNNLERKTIKSEEFSAPSGYKKQKFN